MFLQAKQLRHKLRLMVFLIVLPFSSQAQMVKCVRADGSTVYQDGICPVGAQSKTISAPASSASPTVLMTPDSRGHFFARLSINGTEVDGLIDTGASLITISAATARAMNISTKGGKVSFSRTANGIIPTYNKIIDMLKIGNVELYNVEIAITESAPTLIGMSALRNFKITQENGQMILERR